MDQLIGDSEGIAVYPDDILVSGAMAKDHLNNLRCTLQRCQDKGLKFNMKKCVLKSHQ